MNYLLFAARFNFFQNGTDEVTKEEYAKNLEGNIKNLLEGKNET